MKSFLPSLIVATALTSMSGPASADLLRFTVSGDYSATFNLDSSPAPDDFDENGIGFADVPGIYQGVIGTRYISFYVLDFGGGFQFGGPDDTDLSPLGDQVFSGPTSAPSFSPGVFIFTEDFDVGPTDITLTISRVPEPGAWAILGFGIFGVALRVRGGIVTG